MVTASVNGQIVLYSRQVLRLRHDFQNRVLRLQSRSQLKPVKVEFKFNMPGIQNVYIPICHKAARTRGFSNGGGVF